MATKEEIEKEVNDRLNTDIEWSRMKKEDLKTIQEGLDDEEFLKKFIAQYASMVTGDKVEEQVQNWKPGQALRILTQMQNDEASAIDMFM